MLPLLGICTHRDVSAGSAEKKVRQTGNVLTADSPAFYLDSTSSYPSIVNTIQLDGVDGRAGGVDEILDPGNGKFSWHQ